MPHLERVGGSEKGSRVIMRSTREKGRSVVKKKAKAAPAKKNAPAKPKASGTDNVDSFIARHALSKELTLVRAVILGAGKGVTEHIKWNAPSFCIGGDDRITVRLNKGALSLIFHRGAKVKSTKGFAFEDSSGLFEWAAPDRAVITFADAKDVAAKKAALARVAKEWLKATAP